VVQVSWGQARFLVIHMPVLLLIAMYALWKWCGQVRWRNYFYLLVLAVLCGSWALTSVKRMLFTVPELVEQARGNAYAGFTPDWQHFLAMSRWCAEHLPPDAVVASRKAGMSFIYSGGKEFFSINNVLFPDPGTGQSDPDQVLAFLEKNNVRYVIVPSLRYNPEVNDGLTINTMTLLLMGVVNRYPDRVKFVHREGGEEDEPAWLYEIVY
jgi:hypothetical protein